jgi:hypothetical protein
MHDLRAGKRLEGLDGVAHLHGGGPFMRMFLNSIPRGG